MLSQTVLAGLLVPLSYAAVGALICTLEPPFSWSELVHWAGSYGVAGVAMVSAMTAQFG